MRYVIAAALLLTACGGGSSSGVTIVQAQCVQQTDGRWTATAKAPEGWNPDIGDTVTATECGPWTCPDGGMPEDVQGDPIAADAGYCSHAIITDGVNAPVVAQCENMGNADVCLPSRVFFQFYR